MSRDPLLQRFTEAVLAAYRHHAPPGEAQASIARIAAALDHPGPLRGRPGVRLAVCRHLEAALGVEVAAPDLAAVLDAFRAIEPQLEWRRRESHDESASANFADGHANAMILGPGGIEHRDDVWLGASLMAPHVRYTDHAHAPEETYLVFSEGEFRQGDGEWFAPGIGGAFYNPPWITHAMRSGAKPLFAFWALWPEPGN